MTSLTLLTILSKLTFTVVVILLIIIVFLKKKHQGEIIDKTKEHKQL